MGKELFNKAKEIIEDAVKKNQPIKLISHFDTDGITSAAIMSRTLERLNVPFSIEILKSLEKEYLENINPDPLVIFLDLATNMLPHLNTEQQFIIFDHHEISNENISENILLVHPEFFSKEDIASSAICYLFSKFISEQNKDLASLAVIGMVGDMLGKNINRTYQEILTDAQTVIKQGLLFYPATRPIDRVLENSLSIYIPSVTGSYKEVLGLLKDSGIEKNGREFKSLSEFSEQEMRNLTTSILLKKVGSNNKSENEIIGNIYLIKFFNRVEDARELSSLINACSRMDNPSIALGFCLGNKDLKNEAEKIHIKYKRSLSAALEYVSTSEKISGHKYLIVNTKDKIKDTIIGTVASIMSFSPLYEKGTVIVTLGYREDKKIKVSSRLAGREGKNLHELLSRAMSSLNPSGEVGGHAKAAGCIINKDQEEEFISQLQNQLEVELIKVNQ